MNHIPGQELDQGLEDMWTGSMRGINAIDPGEYTPMYY